MPPKRGPAGNRWAAATVRSASGPNNFPQGRVSDHRINLTLFKLDEVVSGQALDEVIEPLISSDRAARLAALR